MIVDVVTVICRNYTRQCGHGHLNDANELVLEMKENRNGSQSSIKISEKEINKSRAYPHKIQWTDTGQLIAEPAHTM